MIPDLSFGHNLCFNNQNGSCKPVLDIYVSRSFQCYKFFFNPMSFDPCNLPLKNHESIGSPTPKMGGHLGVWGFIPSLSYTFGSIKCDSWAHSWPTHLQALALVTSPRLGLRHVFWVVIVLVAYLVLYGLTTRKAQWLVESLQL